MRIRTGTLEDLTERIKRKAPEYFDLLTAATDKDFQAAFNAVLQCAVAHLEKNKVNFSSLDEVGLTAVLVGNLSIPGLTVTQETHSNGHVDLTIEADHCMPARTKLGEAKIYRGYKYHVEGLEQLLGRYTTGREGPGLLIVYVKKLGIADGIKTLRAGLDKKLPLSQKGPTQDYPLKWSFFSMHSHSCGDDLEVDHIGCNLYIDGLGGKTK